MRVTRSAILASAALAVALAMAGCANTADSATNAPGSSPTKAAGANMRVHKDVKDLTATEKSDFVNAVLKMKATPDPTGQTGSLWDSFVKTHLQSFSCTNGWTLDAQHIASPAHNSLTFLPWHRQFQLELESKLQQVSGNPNLTVPYWDFADPASTKATFSSDFMGGNGDPKQDYAVTDGPFAKGKWTITQFDNSNLGATKNGSHTVNPKSLHMTTMVPPKLADEPIIQTPYIERNFGSMEMGTGNTAMNMPNGAALPTQQDVTNLLNLPDYDVAPWEASADTSKSFRNALEGWATGSTEACQNGSINVTQPAGTTHKFHNIVHIWAAGMWHSATGSHMGSVAFNTSPNDPVFYLLHANLDRIWSLWEAKHGEVYPNIPQAPDGWKPTSKMWPWQGANDPTINDLLSTQKNGFVYAPPQ